MFDHVTIRAADRAASQHFYATVLAALDVELTTAPDAPYAEWDEFSLLQEDAAHPKTGGLHIGFSAPSRDHVDAFWAAGTGAGYRSDGAPGPRPQYRPDYYGAFLLDPDGNSAEAVHFEGVRTGGRIDHLWVRVADVGAERAFYTVIGPSADLRVDEPAPGHVIVRGPAAGSLSLVAGPPTANLHIAFPARDRDAIASFHGEAVRAGYRGNGAPGERPEYHPGYYAAFVLDPAGHNIELVLHDRAAS